MRNFCCISKRFASQRFNLFPGCLLEGRADMVGLRSFRKLYCDIPLCTLLSLLLLVSHILKGCVSFRTVYCDIPLALINVIFLSILLSLLLFLSHILKGCVSFRTVYCDIPLALINVMFLSTLLSLLLLLSVTF
jgi:uncharacterized membrane protein YccF (DUF307 family)